MKIRDAQFIEVLFVVFLGFCLVALSSCSYSKQIEKKVDQEAASQPAIPPGPALAQASEKVIFDAPNLSPAQKRHLEELHAKASAEMSRIRKEIGQHQLVLVKNLVDPKVADSKLRVVRQRILDLEKERTDLWLQSLDDAKKILGRRTETDEQLYRAFLSEPPPATRIE